MDWHGSSGFLCTVNTLNDQAQDARPENNCEICPFAELLAVNWKKKKKCCKSWKDDKRCKKCPAH